MALDRMGYAPEERDQVVAFIDDRNTVVGAPFLKTEHYPVFDCAIGERAIHYMGHVKMMGAVSLPSRAPSRRQSTSRGDLRRRGRRALHGCLEARRQGDRHLPRQLQGRAAALEEIENGRAGARTA